MAWLPLYDDVRWAEVLAETKVSKWPRPDTTRVDCAWRWIEGEGLPFPRATRAIFRFQPFLPATDMFFGWVDLVLLSATVAEGTTGTDADGRSVIHRIEHYESPAVDPEFGQPGITWVWEWRRSGFETLIVREILRGLPFDPGTQPYRHRHDPRSGGFPHPFSSNFVGPGPPDWLTSPVQEGLTWSTAPECYDLT